MPKYFKGELSNFRLQSKQFVAPGLGEPTSLVDAAQRGAGAKEAQTHRRGAA
jgi:hypothetical protein